MKIAVFHNLPPGGALRVVNEQVKYLKKKHMVEVYTCDLNLTGNRLARDWQNFFSLHSKHKALAKKINNKGYDVVLVHPDKLTQAPFILGYLTAPKVYFCEELLRIGYEKQLEFDLKVNLVKRIYEKITRLARKHVDKVNARRADIIIAASGYIKTKINKAYSKKAYICPLGVDTRVFKFNPTRPNQLLFIGEESKINGIDLARKVSQLTKLPLKVISGWKLTDNQLVSEYSKSIVLAVSYNEPFGLVPLEAGACGAVVLAVNQGGYKQTIKHTKTGFLVKRDAKEFARLINTLLADERLRVTIGKQARQRVVSNYTWDKHGQCLEKILQSV